MSEVESSSLRRLIAVLESNEALISSESGDGSYVGYSRELVMSIRAAKTSIEMLERARAALPAAPSPESGDEPVAWLDAAADDVISATQKLRWEQSGRWKLVAEDYKTPLYIRPQAAESKAEQRMSALYKVVSEVVASDDRALNITRLHDYLSGEDIPASAVVCEAEPDERAFNAGRDSVERPPAAEPQGQQHTGWPPGMLQDDSRELARALSSKPDARLHVREAAAAIRAERVPLTSGQIEFLAERHAPPVHQDFITDDGWEEFARAIEAAHGIRGKS